VRLAALCDEDAARAEHVAGDFGVDKSYASPAEMLESEQLDFVDIATRPDSHRELVEMAANRGLPVLCQKPLANSLDEAAEIVRIAQEHNVPLMVTENWRWLPMYRAVRQYIQDGQIGRPHSARILGSSLMRRKLPVSSTQPYFAQMPRLLVLEMCVHWIDCMRAMFGDVRQVFARTCRVNPVMAGEDVATLMLGFDDGASGLIDASWACPDVTVPGEALRVEGELGALSVHAKGEQILFNRYDSRQAEPLQIPVQSEAFYLLHGHFLDRLENGGDFETSGQDNLNTLATVFAAYESAETSQVVEVPQISA
jgi:predicted dehydrogenase